MNATIRRIVVSGTAAVALAGGATATAVAATPEHQATVIAIARTDTTDPNGITNGLTPDGGSGSPLQNPYNQQQLPTGYNQQVTTQASGGTIGVGIVSLLILGIVVFYKVKHGGLKVADAALGVVAGVAVGGTFLGPTISNMTNSLVGSIGSAISGL